MSTRYLHEESVVEVRCNTIPLRMIERIEEFRMDVNAQALSDLRVFHEGRIEVWESRQAD